MGEALVQAGLIDERQLREALRAQVDERRLGLNRQLGEQLVDSGVITESQLRQTIAAWLGNRVVDPTHYRFDPEAVALVPQTVAQREAVVRQIEVDLANTEIRSPVKGTVVQRSVELGQTVAASLQAPTLFLV
ncbi:MAG: hypothetical protein ACK4GK_18940, partial [Ferrovibrio sp.]